MAGVKGRSGGPRPNSGGARAGAGRKPKAAPPESANLPATQDPLVFLLAVQNDPEVDIKQRIRASIAAAQYKHAKVGEGGKKEQRQASAEKVASRFAPSAPPKLVAAGGKKV